jgi:hypothetical protein
MTSAASGTRHASRCCVPFWIRNSWDSAPSVREAGNKPARKTMNREKDLIKFKNEISCSVIVTNL